MTGHSSHSSLLLRIMKPGVLLALTLLFLALEEAGGLIGRQPGERAAKRVAKRPPLKRASRHLRGPAPDALLSGGGRGQAHLLAILTAALLLH